jgi:hypothetical protein
MSESQRQGRVRTALMLSDETVQTGATVYTETGTDLATAQDHLASSLTGGLYIQAEEPQRLSSDQAGLVKAEGGKPHAQTT